MAMSYIHSDEPVTYATHWLFYALVPVLRTTNPTVALS